MKKICLIIILTVICFSFNAVASDYEYELEDPVGDVENLFTGNTTTEYQDIDIIFFKIEENNENIIFSLKVNGEEIANRNDYKYTITIKSNDSSKSKYIWYKNNSAYFFIDKTRIDNSTEVNMLTLITPKSQFNDISMPWNITVSTLAFSKYHDEVKLKGYDSTTNGDSDGVNDEGDSKDKGVPGFEIIAIFLASFITIILLRRKKR